jgi:hypothetical protein
LHNRQHRPKRKTYGTLSRIIIQSTKAESISSPYGELTSWRGSLLAGEKGISKAAVKWAGVFEMEPRWGEKGKKGAKGKCANA